MFSPNNFLTKASTLASCVALLSLMTTTAVAQSTSTSYSKNGGTYQYSVVDGKNSIKLEIKGDVEFLDDDSGIRSLSEGGFFKLETREGRETRNIEITSDSNGGLDYSYRVNGKDVSFDDAAQKDFAEVLLDVFRTSGLDADRRVARILRQSGVEGVFDEIDLLEGSNAHVRYFTELADQGNLNARQLTRLANMTDRIKSSGDRTRFLMATTPLYLANESATGAFFDSIETIPSSGDHTRALLNILASDLEQVNVVRTLRSVPEISSSGDKARVLIAAIPHYNNDSSLRDAYFDAVETVSSSGDQTRVLIALVEQTSMDADATNRLFQASANISSDGDRARLLIAASDHLSKGGTALNNSFFKAVSSLSSSGNHARVLSAVLNTEPDRSVLLGVVESARHISSSGDKSRVLIAAAPQMTDDELVEAYLAVVETIASSGDQSRALKALMKS